MQREKLPQGNNSLLQKVFGSGLATFKKLEHFCDTDRCDIIHNYMIIIISDVVGFFE